ncbi:5929_t:CDS:2 [Cetraspora pellucida]|uniref:5929_t:CDS:1 n=1 Tax=Cetraspora pellucida TaxID=1433469 RepID=A0A9N9N981_9GLOM|nr:5929_t:CDS:2 [Cetraspora pellucida]
MTESNKQLQYEELSLLISMFNDNEFKWVGNQDQLEHWKSALDKFMSIHDVSGLDVSPFRFRILLDMGENWFNVFLPCRYPEIRPECYFSSDTVTKLTWTEINQEIENKLNERCDGGWCRFSILFRTFGVTLNHHHIKSFLQQRDIAETSIPELPQIDEKKECSFKICRILIWTHHLLSFEKRKCICRWANELGIWGFSKPGYPGIIIVEGLYDNVQDYISRLKSLRWQAITILSEESEVIYNLPLHDHDKFIKIRLGRIKPGVSEFECMSEISSKMKEAGLEEMFLSAMKINKKSDKSLT